MNAGIDSQEYRPRLDLFNRDCLDLFKDLQVSSLLGRVAQIASAHTNASYCVCGLNSSRRGSYSQYKIYGLTPSELILLRNVETPIRAIPSEVSFYTQSQAECQQNQVFQTRFPHISSLLFVPIYFNEDRIGSIALMNKIDQEHFTDNDLQMMENLSTYAGMALNNASLYNQAAARERMLTKRNEDLGLLNELGRIFAHTDGVTDHLAVEMMGLIMGVLNMEVGEFFLNSGDVPDTFDLVFHEGHNIKGSILGWETFERGEGLLGEVAAGTDYYLFNNEELEIINDKAATHSKLNYFVILPVATNAGTLGLMVLGTRLTRGQERPDINFLQSIAAWIAPLIENLRAVRAQKKLAILEERDRIGMDLHDGVIQSIYAVGLVLENARLLAVKGESEKAAGMIQTSIEAINATIRDIRSYIMNLKPTKLTHENIVQSLARLANDFHANTLVPAEFKHKVEHVEALSDEQTNTFYMICKEALSNIAKHAHASKVTVNFNEEKDKFILVIQDDGVGFDTGKDRGETHHGVTNMHARTRGLGGDMIVISAIGKGTTVIASLPLKKPE